MIVPDEVERQVGEGHRIPRPVAQVVLQHHERLDGSGYPWE